MRIQDLTIAEFADLLKLEAQRGIIDGIALLKLVEEKLLPKTILDTRGAVRLTIERGPKGLSVTEYPTELATERIMDLDAAA